MCCSTSESQNLCGAHLFIQELDDPAQLFGDRIGHENKPYPSGARIRFYPAPKLVGLLSTQEVGEPHAGVVTSCFPPLPCMQHELISASHEPIRSIIRTHLRYDFASNARCSLRLDNWHSTSIKKEMVERPASAAIQFLGYRGFALEQGGGSDLVRPPARVGRMIS